MNETKMTSTVLPTRLVGPVAIKGPIMTDAVMVPLATYETPLWPSTARGARVSRRCSGITVVELGHNMTRSILLETNDLLQSVALKTQIEASFEQLAVITRQTSRFAMLQNLTIQMVGRMLYIRLAFECGDASGHNMATKAAQAIQDHLLAEHNELFYVSVSGNYCTDKKVSAVNSILGRGRHMIAELLIPELILTTMLRTTAQEMVNLHIKKNLIGSIVAGSVCSANAHFANVLLALYLATGQDAANIVEGSQGVVHCEAQGDDLLFSVTLPNIIVGAVGHGKKHDFVTKHLEMMGCVEQATPGDATRRLAAIVAATVLCSELSLLAALTNPGELIRSHLAIERSQRGLMEEGL